MKSKTAAILIAAAVLAGFLAGVLAHSRYQAHHTPEPKVDTVYVSRSAEIFGPSPVESTPRQDLPPVVIPSDRIVPSADTSAVLAVPETVTFRDTLAKGVVATAVVTGIQPTLDHLHITWPETTITKTSYKPLDGWSLGVAASGAYTAISPFITGTATVSYTAGPVRFRVDAGVIYQPAGRQLSPYVGGGVELTIFRFRK